MLTDSHAVVRTFVIYIQHAVIGKNTLLITVIFGQGVQRKRVVEEAERMIEDLQLQDKRNTPSQKLSGGMKRKLRYILQR